MFPWPVSISDHISSRFRSWLPHLLIMPFRIHSDFSMMSIRIHSNFLRSGLEHIKIFSVCNVRIYYHFCFRLFNKYVSCQPWRCLPEWQQGSHDRAVGDIMESKNIPDAKVLVFDELRMNYVADLLRMTCNITQRNHNRLYWDGV